VFAQEQRRPKHLFKPFHLVADSRRGDAQLVSGLLQARMPRRGFESLQGI
jgi:hypothetical protein